MDGKVKFPRNQGRPIAVGRARAEQMRWKKNPNNKGMTESFSVDVALMVNTLRDNPKAAGIEFCNGLSDGEFAPVMAAVTEEGEALAAFNSTEPISLDEFNKCRAGWEERYKSNPSVTQFFYLGEESIMTNIEDFDVTRYQACFVEKANGKDSGLLLGYSTGVEKDPGGDDDPDTALNLARICPPHCGESI